ncbi:OmpL47-type beta-barrel domain-containing protein [Methanocella sp. MCL-LM]|uniref:OmpL47-type beta-barrel domain-containing protein n=1 Tax=Methanocella sp. MCL-LM TaxID=3412035 RepID=UPI003C769C3C
MRYVLVLAVLALVLCAAPISAAAPSIVGVSADRAFFNPDTGSVEISYELADIINGCPAVSIYGQSGKVKDISAGTRSTGNHSIAWDGTYNNKVAVPDGEYTILVYLADIDSARQPRLIKVFGSISGLDEHVPGLLSGTARNSSGYTFVADAPNNSIQIFSQDGALVSVFGNGGTGDGEFMSPVDVAINASNFVFVSDDYNSRVQVFNPEGRFVASWRTTSEPGADYSFAGPVAVNSSGFVYIVCSGERKLDNKETPWTPDRQYYNQIQVFSPGGELVRSFGSYGTGDGELGKVSSLAIDREDNVYVADLSNHRVMILDQQGNYITAIDYSSVGVGDSYNPSGIAIGSAGHIYTMDQDRGRVDVFSPIVVGSVRVSVDKTPPFTDAIQSSRRVNDWHNSSVRIDLEATDGGSGVKELNYIMDDGPVHRIEGAGTAFVVANGVHKLEYWSIDKVGNEGKHNSIVIQVDSVPPVTNAKLTGTGGDNGWYRSDVTVNLTAEDASTGVHRTQHSYDGSEWLDRALFTVSKEGENPVYFRSIDYAGNVESQRMLSIKIDKTAPSIDCTFEGSSPQGWFTSDVTVTLTPEDGGSGIAKTEYSMDGITWNNYTAPFIVPPGNQNKVHYRTLDMAGNVAAGNSYLYFWPTSIPDIYELVNNVPVPAPSSPATVAPVDWMLPRDTSKVTPGAAPQVPENVTDQPSADNSQEKVRTMVRIIKIVAGFISFLP